MYDCMLNTLKVMSWRVILNVYMIQELYLRIEEEDLAKKNLKY